MATLCVINDNSALGTLLADLLSDWRGDCLLCWTSRDAFDDLTRARADLVILDVMTTTPESGWDILTFLKMHPRLCSLPVIVCSAVNEELFSKEEWLRAHHIEILRKPFDLEELYGLVDAALGRAASTQE
jgi:DNA-binding response OmpR family regulator